MPLTEGRAESAPCGWRNEDAAQAETGGMRRMPIGKVPLVNLKCLLS